MPRALSCLTPPLTSRWTVRTGTEGREESRELPVDGRQDRVTGKVKPSALHGGKDRREG